MRIPVLLAVLAAAACAGTQPVAVAGPAPDRARLAGQWVGEFQGETGRTGSIQFTFTTSGDSAVGDIQMIGDEGVVTTGPEGRPTLAPIPMVLTVRFVRIAGDRIRGVLEDYRDPVCGCRVTTVFEGTLRGDVIAGEYRTRHTEHPRETRGTWRVARRQS